MSVPFSLYAARVSGLHALHPLTRLALLTFCMALAFLLPGEAAPYLIEVALLLPLALWGRVTRLLLRALLRGVLPFAVSLFLIQGLFWTGGHPLLALGPVALKAEGLRFAALMTGRILVILSGFLLLSFTTRPDALMLALVQRGMPDHLAYLVLTTLQIVPRFQAKAAAILDAQRSRGLETAGSLPRRLRALVPLVIPLVLGSIVDIEERAIALEARAFSRRGPRTSLFDLPDSRLQRAFRRVLVALLVLLTAARLALTLRR